MRIDRLLLLTGVGAALTIGTFQTLPAQQGAEHIDEQAEQAADVPAEANAVPNGGREWWSPGDGKPFPRLIEYDNPYGRSAILNSEAPLETKGHPFFEPLGPNGRACVSCHQPADGMSLSVASIQERWEETDGKDPIFAAIDGSNCPNLPQGVASSHSLLLERGLFRIFLPWPADDPWSDGKIEPEFTIEVVRDPTGCNLSEEYGLANPDNPMISVWRRPRMVANLPYVVHRNFGIGAFVGKTGEPALRDPENGEPVNMNFFADARVPTLKVQALEASVTHLQMVDGMSKEQIDRIRAFEDQIWAAQVHDEVAGDLTSGAGSKYAGPENLANGDIGFLGNNITRWVFPLDAEWGEKQPGLTDAQNERRASIRRGQQIFHFRTFWIKDSMHLNTVGLGNPVKRTCATCHGMHMTGLDTANGWMDIGTTNLPWAKEEPLNPWNDREEQMPLFKITCRPDVAPHPFLGRVIYTQDPGRALISGKCNDVGTIVMQQFRAVASRAPYFSNGSAANLRELIDFYDRRYAIGYTEREKRDLENFMGTL